jgi:hypothetical protein
MDDETTKAIDDSNYANSNTIVMDSSKVVFTIDQYRPRLEYISAHIMMV